FIGSPQTACNYSTCPTCVFGSYQRYKYDGRGCEECYCEWPSTNVPANRTCPLLACDACHYYQYLTYRTNSAGCQECYCEMGNTTSPLNAVTTDSSLNVHPGSYWSMSRSSLLSIILNLKQQAQNLIDNAKDTYDHVLHSVIVNDLKKRREADKEDQIKDQVDNKRA
ncbi:hypothetical protein ACJMK2_039633, partial [Sinanodonta woodiana]